MPKDKKEKKQEPDKEEEEEEEEAKEEKKADTVPQWALELKATMEKLVDVMSRKAEPEAKAEEEEKQEDDKKPDEEEEEAKQDDEEVEEEEEEEKKEDDATPEPLTEQKFEAIVEKVIAKRFGEVVPEKKGVVPGAVKPKGVTMQELFDTPWSEIHKMANSVRRY